MHKPEREQRLREGIRSGRFHDADELLIKALDALSEEEATLSKSIIDSMVIDLMCAVPERMP
jgi:Arc/MetJ-type ribon-helix-helix transcriptional regulator